MPVAYVDIPAGVNDGAKKKIFQGKHSRQARQRALVTL
jgi:hypothetical protein